ncbi:MAG: porphobilinogen synthase [Halobacteria archaeon]
MSFAERRMRRMRGAETGELRQETTVRKEDLVAPLFVDANLDDPLEIESMPGYYRHPVEEIAEKAGEIRDLRIPAVILFGVPDEKDERGSAAYSDDGVVQKAVREIKSNVDDLLVITDVCMCEYTSHGHCGLLDDEGRVDNDATLPHLSNTAVSHARAGADVVAPSANADGMVGSIRESLDRNGFSGVGILSYSVKYASDFYGPFRDAADSSPEHGDRSGYQMDPANRREAKVEARLDVKEGADALMVKPALPYLDVVREVRNEYDIPLTAYNVSGEYAMLKAADEKGWMNAEDAAVESLTSIKRAGADFIITYWAEELAGNHLIR